MIKATYIDHMGSDLSIVNAARVSFGKKSDWKPIDVEDRVDDFNCLQDKDAKLIKYLAKHKHMSPFGHAFISVHVKAPIFVARQLVKHKFLRWNEISRRYVDSEPEFYSPVWRESVKDKKQGSGGDLVGELQDKNTYQTSLVEGKSVDLYKEMLRTGVCPEQARMVLPQSTMTEWYWSGSLDAFADMCKLRLKEDTQYETRLVAQQVDEIIKPLFPVAWKELLK